MDKKQISNFEITDNLPPYRRTPVVSLDVYCNNQNTKLNLDWDDLTRGILYAGATGTGKTVCIRQTTKQLRERTYNYSMVIVETKQDYEKHLFKEGDLILGQGEFRERSVHWNIFKDILIDGWDDNAIKANCEEMARYLFKESEADPNKFFVKAARVLFAQALVDMVFEARTSLVARKKLNNAKLREYFTTFDIGRCQRLASSANEQTILKFLLGEDLSNPQALGVLSETILGVLEIFTDIFAEEGDFSIREFVREKKGRTLFLKYDMAYKETQTVLYGLLTNLMIKEMLRQHTPNGNVIYVCDEFSFVGKTDIDTAVNLGRAKGFVCLIGLQSIEQVYEIYGTHKGNSVLAGLRSKFMFQLNDIESMNFMKDSFGKHDRVEIKLSVGGNIINRNTDYIASDRYIYNLGIGECICKLSTGTPFLCYNKL